jgi:hypothetical protein
MCEAGRSRGGGPDERGHAGGRLSLIERDDRITAYSLLLHRGDYAAFRAWAIVSGYGDSAVAFRGLWRAFTQQRRGVDPETLERHRWALDAAVRFITENGGNPDVVKSLLVLAEWGQ